MTYYKVMLSIDTALFYLPILAIGCVAGFMAGLLGIGGGLIIVPALTLLLSAQGYDNQTIMHIALGTSLASIVFTSLSSIVAHHRHAAILWPTVVRMSAGIGAGTFAGALLADHLSTDILVQIFGTYALVVAAQMGSRWRAGAHAQLPKIEGLTLAGVIIGAISSLLGIGGGSLSVPYLMWHSVTIRKAVATAAANGLPIAVAGAVGYAISGLDNLGWQGLQVGYVHLGALAALITGSVLLAPLGAKWAHRIDPARLEQFFALLMALIGLKMLLF